MNKNTIIGLVLIFGIFIAYSYLVSPSQEQIIQQKRKSDSLWLANQARRDSTIRTMARARALDAAKEKEKIVASGKNFDSLTLLRMALKDELGLFANAAAGKDTSYSVENDYFRLKFASLGGKIAQVELKKFLTWDKRPLILMDKDSLHFGLSFFANNRIINTDRLYFQPYWPNRENRGKSSVKVTGKDSIQFGMRVFVSDTATGFNPKKFIEFLYTIRGNEYKLRYQIKFEGMEDVIDPSTKYLVLNWNDNLKQLEKSLKMEHMTSTIYFQYIEDKVDYLSETKDEEKYLKNEKIKWISFKQQFFSSSLIADNYFSEPRIKTVTLPGKRNYVKSMLAEVGIPYSSKETKEISMSMYFGPNNYYGLRKYKLDLEKQIPLGWSFLPMAWINIYAVIPVFTFFGNLGWNYGIIILVLTILLKIVLFPIAFKTYKSSAKMRVLKPEIDELSKKFPKKDDAMKKQQATMDLYKKAGVNPMAGCIPLLLQMPILIAMFRFFPSSIELRQQAFLWAKDLSSYDSIWTFPGGFSIPWYGDHVSLFALLMTISSVIYTKINDQMMGSSQQQMPGMKTMMYLMPVMFLVWFNDYSSGLSYYYLLANLLTFAQIYIIRATIDEKQLHAQIEANRKKTVKKSGFQKRLEDMAKKRGYPVKK
ncbi:MAG: membrane protein insertase YidC [Bacteroidales bacterium]|jgi:YidC/Oxa1 family membrane protein insertase|nr:membrane protein insertase YidC [Bacteroidales bacterium]